MLIRGLRSPSLFACYCDVFDDRIVAGILIADPETNPEQTRQLMIDVDKEPDLCVVYPVLVPELFATCSYNIELKRCLT